MDSSTLVTIVVSAIAGAIAKEAVSGLIAYLKGGWLVDSVKKRLGVASEVGGVVVYTAFLIAFARADTPVTGIVVLEILGCSIGLLLSVGSLLFRMAKRQVRLERERTAKSTGEA